MISVILHSILAFLTVAATLLVYAVLRKGGFKDKISKNFFGFFFFFTGTHLSVIIPFFLFPFNLTAMAWGYIVSIAFVFMFLFQICKAEFNIMKVSPKKTKIFLSLFLLVGVAVILIQIYDFRLPIIHESGFIFWNTNLAAAWITSLAASLTAIAWAVIFIKNFPQNVSFSEKLKLWFFIIGAAVFVGNTVTYFTSQSYTQSLFSFICLYLGTILIAAPFAISKIKYLASGK